MEEKLEQTEDKEYAEYLKSFIKTKGTFYRKIPNMRGIVDFDYVDENSSENMLSGYSVKYCVRANEMFFRDLINQIRKNPNLSYGLCYTNEEIVAGDFPNYFSVIMKEPSNLFSIETEVFASRILSYFGTPVAYNRRIDKAIPHYGTSNYLMSIDMIRKNEKLVLLNEIVPFLTHIDIGKFDRQGVKNTLDLVGEYLEIYLTENDINFTSQEIEDYKKFLAASLLERVMLLGDNDLRNGNAGILIDFKNKSFRALPNFDMEKSFSSMISQSRFEHLKEFYELYPDVYDDFIMKMLGLFDSTKKGELVYENIARKAIREESIANSVMYGLYNNAAEIWDETMRFRKSYGISDAKEKGE